jgi:starch-binding outer membrane protein, SusD/RagB family
MKKIAYIILMAAALSSCTDFLDVQPKAILSEAQVAGADNADKFTIAAYASLGNDHYNIPFSLWPYGNVRSGDAYKGGRDEADIQAFYFMETFKNMRTDFGEVDGIWYNIYVGISRANTALRDVNTLTETEYPNKKVRQAEMRFLRAHWYFLLKEMFKYIPYIDETVAVTDYEKISNKALTNDQLWDKIADDFKFAADNLPTVQPEVGRVNRYAAQAYLAKTRLYQAYEQDDQNNVININTDKLNQVISLCDSVMSSTYRLETDFGYNFMPGAYENGNESLFAVQFSHDDGTSKGRLNYGDILSTPQGLGCCDFHKPSQNLANAFKTDAKGLPMFDTFNSSDLDLSTNTVDPRLNHTIAMPGHPWKYDPTLLYDKSWNRSPDVYGYFASLKENVSPKCDCFIHIDPFYGNTKNRIIIRFADVLLWKAEALIELNRQDEALPLINQVRNRAKRSTGNLKMANGNYESNFSMSLYVPGTNCIWTKDYARQALRWERRLEFAMEGNRFFDLVRWGIADTYLNTYFAQEKTKRTYLKDGMFTKNRDEYLPIPYNQINFSKGVYKQNYGY